MKNTSGFVAINYIECTEEYVEKLEFLFKTRAGEIDKLPGFRQMNFLRPNKNTDKYLIVSYWDNEKCFVDWTKSDAFLISHKRGFEDIKKYKEKGLNPPVKSEFKTYTILSN